jgi:DNA polymerase-1
MLHGTVGFVPKILGQRYLQRKKRDILASSLKDMPEKTLYILDGTSMLYIGYHSLMGMRKYYDENEMANRPPLNTISVLTHNFAKFVADVNPQFIAVAFDCAKKTFRNDLFPEYKQGRVEVLL